MTAAPPHAPAPIGRTLLMILVVSTLVRLAAASLIPLLDDEAHYWVWARHLMWGYPDHPPMIAGVVAAGTALFGDTVLGIRIFPVLAGTITTALLYTLAARLFGPRAGLRAALLFLVIPTFAAGGVITTPDGPFGLFWVLAMLLAWSAFNGARWAWPAAGAAAALALQSKLAAAALAVAFVGFVLTSAEQRRWLRTPWPYLAVLVGAAILVPLVGWNLGHDWATVRRAFAQDPWVDPTTVVGNLARFLGVHFVYYAPLGLPILAAAIWATVVRSRGDERFRFLLWCVAPTLVLSLVAATRSLAKPHYTGPALLCALVAAAGVWPQWRWQRALRAGVLTSSLLTLVVLLVASVPTPVSLAFHQEARAWGRVANEVERILPSLGPAGQVFVLAETYQAGSQLAFALRDRVAVVVPFRGFDLWEPPAAWVDRNGLLMDHLGGSARTEFSQRFDRVLAPYIIPVGNGRDVRLYPGIRFRGL